MFSHIYGHLTIIGKKFTGRRDIKTWEILSDSKQGGQGERKKERNAGHNCNCLHWACLHEKEHGLRQFYQEWPKSKGACVSNNVEQLDRFLYPRSAQWEKTGKRVIKATIPYIYW